VSKNADTEEDPATRRERWVREGIDITPSTRIYSGDEAARRGRALIESAVSAEELAELDKRIK